MLCLGVGIIWTLLFESPIVIFEKLIFTRDKKTAVDTKSKNEQIENSDVSRRNDDSLTADVKSRDP